MPFAICVFRQLPRLQSRVEWGPTPASSPPMPPPDHSRRLDRTSNSQLLMSALRYAKLLPDNRGLLEETASKANRSTEQTNRSPSESAIRRARMLWPEHPVHHQRQKSLLIRLQANLSVHSTFDGTGEALIIDFDAQRAHRA